jgi:hypothetical protein
VLTKNLKEEFSMSSKSPPTKRSSALLTKNIKTLKKEFFMSHTSSKPTAKTVAKSKSSTNIHPHTKEIYMESKLSNQDFKPSTEDILISKKLLFENFGPLDALYISAQFNGIWVPGEIWIEPISRSAKILWAKIWALDNSEKGGCYASNEYLCQFMQIKVSRLKEILAELRKAGLLESISFNGRMRVMKAIMPKNWASYDLIKRKKSLPNKQKNTSASRKTGRLPAGKPAVSIYSRDKSLEKKKQTKRNIVPRNLQINNCKKSEPSSPPTPQKGGGHELGAHDVCVFLLKKLRENHPGFKEPNLDKWRKEVERMVLRDRRSIEDLMTVIGWAFSHSEEFWQTCIQSPTTLSKIFDRAWRKMQIEKSKTESLSRDEKAEKDRQLLGDENKKWALQKLENLTFLDKQNYLSLGENGVYVTLNNRCASLAYASLGFREKILSFLENLKFEVVK